MAGAPEGAGGRPPYVSTGTGDEHIHVSSRSGPFPTTTSPKDPGFGRAYPSGAGTPRVGGHGRGRPVIVASSEPQKLGALIGIEDRRELGVDAIPQRIKPRVRRLPDIAQGAPMAREDRSE